MHSAEQGTKPWCNGKMVISDGTKPTNYKAALFSWTLTEEKATMAKKKNQSVASAWTKTKKK